MRHTTRNRNNRIRAQKNRKRIALLAKRAKKTGRPEKNPAEAGF